jgi:DNA-binding GntR family transcriptional regulator
MNTRVRPSLGLPPAGEPAEAAQDLVYRLLKKRVLTLPAQQGAFLTEAEVCRVMGTSRTPVREALLRLESEGLLQILPKKGAFVPPMTESEVVAVMQARGLVEEWCARRAATANDGSSEELQRLLGEQEALRSDPLAFIECDREFHRTLVVAADNPFVTEFYESLRDRQVRMGLHVVVNSAERMNIVLAEHGAIVDAIRSGDSEAAAAAIALHLAKSLVALQSPGKFGWKRGGGDPASSIFAKEGVLTN